MFHTEISTKTISTIAGHAGYKDNLSGELMTKMPSSYKWHKIASTFEWGTAGLLFSIYGFSQDGSSAMKIDGRKSRARHPVHCQMHHRMGSKSFNKRPTRPMYWTSQVEFLPSAVPLLY
jgi:hypothetical protein